METLSLSSNRLRLWLSGLRQHLQRTTMSVLRKTSDAILRQHMFAVQPSLLTETERSIRDRRDLDNDTRQPGGTR